MDDKLLNELLATSKDQLRLLQIIANRLVDGRSGLDEKPEAVAGKSKEMSDEEKAKWSLAGKKAWATRLANRAKATAGESKVADSEEEQAPVTNKDEISLFGTNEWSVATMNCFKGCENACAYCYAQANFSRYDKNFTKVKDVPVAKDWDKFAKDFKAKCRKNKGMGKVMFPSVHDITPLTLDYCIRALKHMLEFDGNIFEFLIVTKPRIECVSKLCKELEPYKDRILFRFTIGSADEAVLKFWEPGASSFAERLDCVKYAYGNGFRTSISIEPRLDADTDAVIRTLYPYVTDAIWLGSANNMKFRLKMNGCADEKHLLEAAKLERLNGEDKARDLYAKWGTDPKIKWKESLKKVLGLELGKEKGADV